MNLINLLKNKKVKYFSNILLILTVLFSFITIILISTLLNGAIQAEVMIILVASSILLLFNLVLSRFVKNKVLLLVINLVLCVSLIGSSIALFVNLQKFKVVEGFQTVSEAQAAVEVAQVEFNSYQNSVNNSNNIASIKEYTDNVNSVANNTFKESDYMDITILTNIIDNYDIKYNNMIQIDRITDQGKNLNDYISLLNRQKTSLIYLAQLKTNLENAKIALTNAQQLASSSSTGASTGNATGDVSGYTSGYGSNQPIVSFLLNDKLKAIEGVSYITAITSIFSGITIALTNLLMFSGKY